MNDYSDIINVIYNKSNTHSRMSIQNRAFQFSPFAALTGYSEEINEASRLTNERIEIDDGLKSIINNKLQFLSKKMYKKGKVEFTYFLPDLKKEGGTYVIKEGYINKIDLNSNFVIMSDKTFIPINEIINIRINP